MIVVFIDVTEDVDALPSCCREYRSGRVDLLRLAPCVDLVEA